jgi:L-ribulose-5-phosphate 3-epimerase
MNPIGIMQGRLSPPVGGRIQSFPVDCWREEFFRAREAGLNCIEWVYEFETEARNRHPDRKIRSCRMVDLR